MWALLAAGAELDAADLDGTTVLKVAAKRGSLRAVQVLLGEGGAGGSSSGAGEARVAASRRLSQRHRDLAARRQSEGGAAPRAGAGAAQRQLSAKRQLSRRGPGASAGKGATVEALGAGVGEGSGAAGPPPFYVATADGLAPAAAREGPGDAEEDVERDGMNCSSGRKGDSGMSRLQLGAHAAL